MDVYQTRYKHAEEGDLRLVGETTFANWQLGRLEVFFEGSWSQVCGAQVFSSDVAVACRQLGFTGAGVQFACMRTRNRQRSCYNINCLSPCNRMPGWPLQGKAVAIKASP